MRDSSLRRSTRLTTSAISFGVGAGWRSSRVTTCRIWDTVTAGVFPPDSSPLQAQEPQRHQGQRHVVVPADPTPHLVVVQPRLAVAGLEQLLDPMPLTLHPDQFGQRDL